MRVELRPWNVFPAVLGSVSVIRRLSAEPAVSDDRLDRAMDAPITAREASTVVVEPSQV